MRKHTRSYKAVLHALVDLLKDHQRIFPEAHPHSTIRWGDCEEVKNALAAIKLAEANPNLG